MTEAEWLAGNDFASMLDVPTVKGNMRKARLFACSLCRQVWVALRDARSRKAVTKLEEFADGSGDQKVRRDAYSIANAAFRETYTQWDAPTAAACAVLCAAYPEVPPNLFGNVEYALRQSRNMSADAARRLQVELLRDIFGNPFRPVSFSPSWRTDTALSLARQMYAARDFSAMPILADALQDAGCDNEDILTHCRSGGEHVRGCWVVDLLLGRE